MEKYRNSIRQFLKFGIVGGSGTIVNLVITVLAKKISWWTAQISEHDVAMNLFGSQFNIRWFNIFAIIAFLVANLWNFQSYVDVQSPRWWQLVQGVFLISPRRNRCTMRDPDYARFADEPHFAVGASLRYF